MVLKTCEVELYLLVDGRMASFIGRLKSFVLFTFCIAMVAIITMLYYSLRYSYASRLEIKYFGTLKIEKDLRESASFRNSSNTASSANLSPDNGNLLQTRLPSNYSEQKIKVSEIKNNNYSESTSNNGLTNQLADGSEISHEHSNRSSINEEQNGVAMNRSNVTHVQDENLCPKNLSSSGKRVTFLQYTTCKLTSYLL